MLKEEKELELIIQVLKQSKHALASSEIKEKINIDITDKTLLRRLNKLRKQDIIMRNGEGRGITYELATAGEKTNQPSESKLISLSVQSKNILALVNRPQNRREPKGYNKRFLESYKPNITNYLSESEKKALAAAGRTARQNEPAGTYAKDILQRLLIDLSYNSSRLEGNTYSLLDTERLISIGEAADNKPAQDAQMILNHKDAIEFIVDNPEEIGFNRYTILNLHALLSNNLLHDPAATGRLRTFGVGIQQSVYTPLGIPQVIEEMFDKMLQKVNRITDPFEQAFFVMVHLPYLQPFVDVNKRVSRLAANISLNKKNLVPISFIDVPNQVYIKGMLAVYELNRVELLKDVFIWAYERSSARYSSLRQTLGEPDPFRLKHWEAIRSLILEIVSKGLPYREANNLIGAKIKLTQPDEQNKLREIIETELMSLHEGNIARFTIRPVEFTKWKSNWQKKRNP